MTRISPDASGVSLLLAGICLILPCLWGCRELEPVDPFQGTRRDSAGIEIVEHGAVWDYEGPVYRISPLMTISEALPDGAGEFGRVGDVELLPGGRHAKQKAAQYVPHQQWKRSKS